ncbi:carbon-nitrogen hydrolase family protein [Pelotomaculum schinkii]|uniref:carbon-nitrogen hydrolase family protein n=1 Tax=Pelotomaculum schinkii TaxID=78350 RepID=UPI00167D4F3B|nr:carbon-nitrogen hydrolase family protein [Pelotomaculum schinkii]
MRAPLKIGICQMPVTEDKDINNAKARSMLREAAEQGSQLVILPEMFNCPYKTSVFQKFAEQYPGGKTIAMLSEVARQEQIYLVGGSIPELEDGVIYNTSFIFGPGGELLGKHQKIHLFDADIEDGPCFQESKALGAGSKATVVETPLGTIGVCVCYDIRFPELSRSMVLRGAELIIIPAAFNMTTGPAHWELLLKARAVDNQAYVVGAGQAPNEQACYICYGHSAVVDPWGRITARAGGEETIIYADIDFDLVAKIRRELPLLKHRRPDLYQIK